MSNPDPDILDTKITLRDYIAIHASRNDIDPYILKGYTEEYVHDTGYGKKFLKTRQATRTVEEARYAYADAMLKARENS